MKFSHQEIIDQIKFDGKYVNICISELYKDSLPIINKLRRKFGVNDEDARDLLQDIIIALIEDIKEGHYKELGSLFGYIYCIAENLLINHYKKKLHRENYIKTLKDGVYENIEKVIYARERGELVKFYMNQLDKRCKDILDNFYNHEMSLKDIATNNERFKNEEVAKNIKGRCFKKLKEIIFKTDFNELKDLINI
jgi:RNA polymerase sigma factor (sigma-70 family)